MDKSYFATLTVVCLYASILAVIADMSAHHISKREITGSGLPTDGITFTFEKTGSWASTTQVKVGDSVPFKLTIWMPNTQTDMKIEIYAPRSNETSSTPFMALCTPVITVPATNFPDYNSALVTPRMDSYTKDGRWDRSIIDLGTINNAANDASTQTESEITIEFDALVYNHALLDNGDEMWVSVGAEYSSRSKVWVGQTSFTGLLDTFTSVTDPTFTLNGPSELGIGMTGIWTLTMTMKDASNMVSIDVFAPLNHTGLMTVCKISVETLGSSYGCYARDHRPNMTYYENDTSVASLDLGQVVNKGFRVGGTADADDTITVHIAATMLNSSEVELNAADPYWLGVSVLIDEDRIWSAQMALTAVEQSLTNLTEAPTFDLSTTSEEVIIGGSTAFLLNMSIPQNTHQTYRVEVALPYNSSAEMNACRVRVRHVGHNYPCLTVPEPIFRSEDGIVGENDYAILDFGIIFNSGSRSDAADDIIQIEIVATVLNAPTVFYNGTIWGTVGVYYGDNMIWIGQNSINVVETPSSNSTPPTFTLTNMMHDVYLHEEASSVYYLDVYFPAGHQYNPVVIDIGSAIDNITNKAFTKLCRVEIIHIGDNLACLTNETTFSLEAKTEDPENKYRAYLNLGIVSNIGDRDWSALIDMSKMKVEIIITATDNPDLTNGTYYWTSSAVQYADDSVWVAEHATVYNEIMADIDTWYELVDDPSAMLVEADADNVLFFGQTMVYDLDIITPPTTVATYDISAATTDFEVTVCRIDITSVPRNVAPCWSKEAITRYTQETNITQNTAAELTIKGLTNVGVARLDAANTADSTLKGKVIIALRGDINDTSSVANGTMYSAAVSVKAGSRRLWLADVNLTANTDAKPSMGTLPQITLYKMNNTISVMKGGAAIYKVDIYVPPGTFAKYNMEVFAPWNDTDYGKMRICDVRIMNAGYNLPCVNDTYLMRSFSDSNDTENGTRHDEAVFGIGHLANTAKTGTVEQNDNKVSIEIVVETLDDADIVEGDQLFVSTGITVDGDRLWVAQIPVDIVETLPVVPEPVTTSVLIPPEDGVEMEVHQTKTWLVNISIPEGTDDLKVVINTSLSGSKSFFHVRNVSYVVVGENIACGQTVKVENIMKTSVDGTTKMSDAVADLGVLTNTGTTKRYFWKEHEAYHDVIQLAIELELMDSFSHFTASEHNFTVNVFGGDGQNTPYTTVLGNATVAPTGSEVVDFKHTVWAELYETVPKNLNPGDVITLYAHFNHTVNSTADAFDVTLHYRIPYFSVYDSSSLNWTGLEPQVTYYAGEEGLEFHYPVVYFTDNMTLSFNITLDPDKTIPIGSRFLHAVIPVDITYKEADRTDTDPAAYPVKNILKTTDFKMVEFDFYVSECLTTLGMEDGRIQDCQIVASSDFNSSLVNARLRSPAVWLTEPRGSPFYKNEYLQVYLGNKTRITGISIQADPVTNSYVTSFTLKYSNEGILWRDVLDPVSGTIMVFEVDGSYNDSSYPFNGESDIFFVPMGDIAFESRYLRLIPQNNTNGDYYHGMRVELHGCPKTDDIMPADVCFNNMSPPYERGYLTDPNDGTLYVCMIIAIDQYPACSKTEDFGVSWTPLDDNLVGILFFKNSTKRFYGRNRNLDGYLRSDDSGDTWFSISTDEFNLAQVDNSDQTVVSDLPFEDWDKRNVTTLFTSFGLSLVEVTTVYYGVSFNGVHFWDDYANIADNTGLIANWGNTDW